MVSAVQEAIHDAGLDAEQGIRKSHDKLPVEFETGYEEQLKRQLSLWEVASFMYTAGGAWITIITTLTTPLYNGGFSSLIFGLIAVLPIAICFLSCLSELISAYPTAGGQYYFVALLAPKKYARLLSFICGIFCAFFWVTVTTANALAVGQTIFAIAAYVNPALADLSRWAQVAVAWGVLIFGFVASVYNVRLVTYITQFQMYYSMTLFVVFVCIMFAMAPDKNSGREVFATVQVASGWTNVGWSWIIGSSYVWFCFIALDSVSHLVEDMRHPRRDAPRANFLGIGINAVCSFIIALVLAFCAGDVDAAVTASPNFPFVAIVHRALKNVGAAVFFSSICYYSLVSAAPGIVLVSSRIIFALARDSAIPGSSVFLKINEKYRTPINATIFATILPAILCFIYVGNTTAFFAITNTASIFAIISFTIPIVLVIIRGRESISTRHFDIGKYGMVCYWVATIFGSFYIIVLCFPFYYPVTAANMNYASAVVGVAIILIGLLWQFYAKKYYVTPIVKIHAIVVSEGIEIPNTSNGSDHADNQNSKTSSKH